MNESILLVMRWINDQTSVSKEELNEAKRRESLSFGFAYHALFNAVYGNIDSAKYLVDRFLEITGGCKEEYLNAIEGEK